MNLLISRAILCMALFGVGVVAARDFEILIKSVSDCDSGDTITQGGRGTDTYVENGKLRVLYTKVLWVVKDGEPRSGKIVGMAACKAPATDKCRFVGEKKGDMYVLIAVTLKYSEYRDQDVYYTYNDKDFKLSQLNPPSDTAVDIHETSSYLYPASVKFETTTYQAKACRENRAEGLISGHGFFAAKLDNAKMGPLFNVYFDPPNIGYYLRFPRPK